MRTNSTITVGGGLALVLVLPLAIFCFSFHHQAHATNESSYKWGYKQGKSEYDNCLDFDADCNTATDDCQSPIYTSVKNETTGYFNSVPRYDAVTNQMACIHGYIHAWNHFCDPAKTRLWPNNELPCPTDIKHEPSTSVSNNSTWHVQKQAIELAQNSTNSTNSTTNSTTTFFATSLSPI